MALDVTGLDTRLRRRSLLAYAAGMAVYALVIVALYPQFKNETSLNDITKGGSTVAALFGATGSLTSPSGWLDANIYQNFFPLVMLLLTVGYGAAAVAGQDEDGTLCLLAVLPLRRTELIVQKVAAMAVQALALAATVAAVVLLGRWFDLTIGVGPIIAVSITVFLLGLDLGLVAMAVGAATGRRGLAIGIATTVAAVSYLVSSLAPVVTWVRPVRYASLFYWAVGDKQLSDGVSFVQLLVLLGFGAVAVLVTLRSYRRLDLH